MPRGPCFDGDKSPAKSADKSAHSKACGCGFTVLRSEGRVTRVPDSTLPAIFKRFGTRVTRPSGGKEIRPVLRTGLSGRNRTCFDYAVRFLRMNRIVLA